MLRCSTGYLNTIFEDGQFPQLLYITKQQFGGKWIDRPMHTHDDICEISLIFHGKGIYRLENHSYEVEKGNLILGNPKQAHELISPSGEYLGVYCFGLNGFCRPDLPANYILPEDSNFILSCGSQFGFFQEMCEHLYQNLNAPLSALNSLIFGTFLSMTLALQPAQPKSSLNSTEYCIAERVKSYIDAHYIEPLTLDQIAVSLNCSVYYLSHAFKNVIGYSPIQYQTRRRIGLAQSYLIGSDYTSTHISTLVGYDNTNYFTTVFTKIVGLTPIKYRKKYLDELRGTPKQ